MRIDDASTLTRPSADPAPVPAQPASAPPAPAPPREPGVVTVEKTLAILEAVAERGGATAREVSEALGFPLPTVYRLLQALVQSDYLVHLTGQHRFELGYKLDRLGVSLHRQIGIPTSVRTEIGRLHTLSQTAAYFAVYRGADVVVAYVVDSPDHPRLTPLNFGFHEATHATAFGKIMLAGMSSEQRDQYLDVHELTRLTATTKTRRQDLYAELAQVATSGVAWEIEEFVPGMTCAAVGVRNGAGMIIGSVAISAPSAELSERRQRDIERHLRDASNQVSRYYRSGALRRANTATL
ncbi:hypothetical protein GCM10025867_26210 [Frondihabitans sucicola]|uniref:IclR family transcriptional regulator n=1 Tax=Frondihabitans sucicola TaxID=1268041 RepID=A0ABN6XZC8_9MICO|nr:IclR family transcriptional regulator [Frondihabitans sucicola]BDZ50380.1 hypothetical protein GCM10025867_26210 [Frondihabitans sucicola]